MSDASKSRDITRVFIASVSRSGEFPFIHARELHALKASVSDDPEV